jgi:hypothetical protein
VFLFRLTCCAQSEACCSSARSFFAFSSRSRSSSCDSAAYGEKDCQVCHRLASSKTISNVSQGLRSRFPLCIVCCALKRLASQMRTLLAHFLCKVARARGSHRILRVSYCQSPIMTVRLPFRDCQSPTKTVRLALRDCQGSHTDCPASHRVEPVARQARLVARVRALSPHFLCAVAPAPAIVSPTGRKTLRVPCTVSFPQRLP